MTAQAGLDPQRVEILKGPQGTLFGQNATGGAINFIAAKPTKTLDVGADLTYSSFNTIDASGYLSGPITDRLRARAAFKVEDGDGWQHSNTRNDTLGKSRVYVGRVLLDWDASDRLSFSANLSGSVDKSDPQAPQYVAYIPQGTALTGNNLLALDPNLYYATQTPSPATPKAADWSTGAQRPSGDDEQFQAALKTTYKLTDDISLTSLTSYVHFTRDQMQNPDGLAVQEYKVGTTGKINDFSQELRISNSASNAWRWMLGANYESSQVNEFDRLFVSDSITAATLGIVGNNYYSNQNMTNTAIFGNTEYNLTDEITLKAGARYTQSDRSVNACTQDNGDGIVAAFFTGLADALLSTPGNPVSITPILPGGCVNLDAGHMPGVFTDKLNQNNVSWRVGADYKPTHDLLFYVNISKGFKSGSFPTATASTDVQFQPVTQESVLDYEGGFKLSALNHRVSLTGAGFYYDYSNKQLRGKLIDPIFGELDALINIPKSHVEGAEFALSAAPFEGFTTSVSATYLDAKIDRYTGIAASGATTNFAGTPLSFAPKFQLAAAADYKFPISEKLFVSIGAGVTHNSSALATVGGDSTAYVNAYTLLDLRAAIGTQDGQWKLAVWGKNVTNKYYWTNAASVNDVDVRWAGKPDTYGLTLSYRLK